MIDESHVAFSFDETTTIEDIDRLIKLSAEFRFK
jgi:hypothetical protein